MSFGLYVIGFAIMIAGVAYAAYLLKVPGTWIAVMILILVGLGVVTGVTTTRRRDPPS